MGKPLFYVHVGLDGSEDAAWFRRVAPEIEGMGFRGVFLADSLSSRNEPLIPLTGFATSSSSLSVGTCVYILPMRNPLIVAKQVSSIHRLCGGRFIFGVGVGWRQWEFDAVGVEYASRGSRTDEMIEILKLAWRDDPVSYNGKHFRFEPIDVGAVLGEAPPIWVGGNSMAAIRRAARYGDAWIPTDLSLDEYEAKIPKLRSELNRLGRPHTTFNVCSHLALIVDSVGAKAHALAAKVASSFNEKPEDFENHALVGDPASVAERIAEYTALGVEHHVLSTFLTQTKETLLDTLRLFSTQVAPSV
ncbi:MAG: TIGR03619 family F420-dependent LLM class oxidoreductase [Thermoprotei archaeon]